MIPAYVYVPPYESDPFPVVIWNAYAPSFQPNVQIDLHTNPLYYKAASVGERAMFYWHEPVLVDYYTGDVLSCELRSIIDGI